MENSFAIPLLDLGRYHRRISVELDGALTRVAHSGRYILGPEVESFEKRLGNWLGGGHVVGVSSGTDAITCALLGAQVMAGGTVVTTPFTFIATVSAIIRAGFKPKFCDVELNSCGLCPLKLEGAGGAEVVAVVLVHLFGLPAQVEAITKLCDDWRLPLIEDAAQALGAKQGDRALGRFGRFGCYSFFPAKSLGALGDGGAVVVSKIAFAQRLRVIRRHGAGGEAPSPSLGGNYRLDALQAAVLTLKLEHLSDRIELCRLRAAEYRAALADVAELRLLSVPAAASPSYPLFTLRVLDRRTELSSWLASCGIETRVYYPTPLHLQPALAHLGYARGDFPNAERLAGEVLSIPMFAELTEQECATVCRRIREFYGY